MANPSRRLKASKIDHGAPAGTVKNLRLLDGSHTPSPSERLLDADAEALTDAELLAVLLCFGQSTSTKAKALDQAHHLLSEHGGLEGLRASNRNLPHQPDHEGASMANLLAAFEIACRLAKGKLPKRDLLTRCKDVDRFLQLRYKNVDQEILGALYLDVRNRLISETEIYRGTLHQLTVEPRQILKQALLRSASGLILWHTHPSGDPAPTEADLRFTQRMVTAGELIGVRIVDHLIVGHPNRWYSIGCRQDSLLEKMKETNNEWKSLKFSCGVLGKFERESES